MKSIKLFLLVLVAAAASLTLNAQEKQNRNVSGFNDIRVSEGIQVTLTMGNTEEVEVIAPANIIDRVVTEIEGTELNIHIKGENNMRNVHVEVLITAKNINKIKVSSGASVKTTNMIKTESFDVSVSSGASANIEIEANNTEASSSSGASMNLYGKTNNLNVDASSGAHISAQGLTSQNVDADVSSGAHIKLHAEKQLKADASSGGGINYSGNPKMVDVDKSSGGSVKRD